MDRSNIIRLELVPEAIRIELCKLLTLTKI